jgi:hypothetical protein
VCALSARWESIYSYWNPLTANTAQVVSHVNANSANWNSTFSTWNATSAFELSARNFINQNNRNIVSNYSHYNANSGLFATYAYANGFLPISGGAVTGNVTLCANLIVVGALTAQKFTVLETQTLPTTASQLTVSLDGNIGTSLTVNQDVLVGRNMFLSGYFLVPGGAGGDSRNWVSNFNNVCALSARWESIYSYWNPLTANTAHSTTYVNNTSSTINSVNSYVNTNRINLSEVATTVNSNSSIWIFNGGNTGAVTVGTNNNTNLSLETNNITRMTVLSGGNIGINQLTPTSRLHVTDNSSNPTVLITQAGAGEGLRITQLGTGYALLVEDVVSDTTPFVIDADGNIGVSTASPTNKITILSNSNNINDYPIRINNNSNNYASGIGAYGISNRIGTSTNIDYTLDIGNDIFFKNNNSNTVVIKSGGNVGISTTTPNERLTVFGNVSANGIIYDSTSSSTDWNISFNRSTFLTTASSDWNTSFNRSTILAAASSDWNTSFNRSTILAAASSDWNTSFNRSTFLTTASGNFLLQGGNTFNGDVSLGTTNSNSLIFQTNNLQRAIITSSGNFGIGKSNPSTILDVNGTVTAVGFSGPLTGNVTGNLTGTASDVADNAITNLKLADNSVTSSKILNGTIVNADINDSAAIAGTKITPSFGSQDVTTSGSLRASSSVDNNDFIRIRMNSADNSFGIIEAMWDNNPVLPANVCINPNGGNIGIATNNPVATLDINGSIGESKTNILIISNTLTLPLNTATFFTVSLNNNITTMTFVSPPANPRVYSFVLQFTADGTPRTVVWPVTVKWTGGIAPTLTSTNGKVDTFTFVTHDGGTNYFGFISGQNS